MLTGCQKDRTTCQKTDWQTDRKTDKDKTTFQLSYQNKCCSECQTACQKDRKTGRQTYRQTERQTDRQTDRKTERLFSLVVKTKVVQNVNRMSKSQSDRQDDMQCARQTEWQRDRMTVWPYGRIAGQLKSPLLFFLDPLRSHRLWLLLWNWDWKNCCLLFQLWIVSVRYGTTIEIPFSIISLTV